MIFWVWQDKQQDPVTFSTSATHLRAWWWQTLVFWNPANAIGCIVEYFQEQPELGLCRPLVLSAAQSRDKSFLLVAST